jgi:hypothetical protein
VPLYFQELGRDMLNCFDLDKALKLLDLRGVEHSIDLDKASKLPDLGSVKHSIDIDGPIPYSPLYNLLAI